LIVLCTYFVPTLEGMYASLRLTPGTALRVLTVLSEAMPFWIVILPLLLVTLIAWRIRAGRKRRATGTRTSGLAGWLPGVSATLHQERCARFADALSGLLNDGLPLAKAVRVAADASGDGQLRASVEQLSTALESGDLPSVDSSTAQRFPHFLRWAIWQSAGTTSRARALEIASRVYRNAAARRGERLGTLAPMVALVVFGGTVTLLYGLALFVPMVELLRALAK
jgi:type II secretory pathway component PulF